MTYESLLRFWFVPLAVTIIGFVALLRVLGTIKNGLRQRHPGAWTKASEGKLGYLSIDFALSGLHSEMDDPALSQAVISARRLLLTTAGATTLFVIMLATSNLPADFQPGCERSDIRSGSALALNIGMRREDVRSQMGKLWIDGPWPHCIDADEDTLDASHLPEGCPSGRVEEIYHVNSWSGLGVVIAYFDNNTLYRLEWYRACGYIG